MVPAAGLPPGCGGLAGRSPVVSLCSTTGYRLGYGQDLFEKIWDRHVVETLPDGTTLLYIDRHLVHEVTSPQAFDGLRLNHRKVPPAGTDVRHDGPQRPDRRPHEHQGPISKAQVEALTQNCRRFRGHPVRLMGSDKQGIVHTIGPELGITVPGLTMVCGDSHTSTHGAFGTLAFGIGTSEVEHVMATQTLRQKQAQDLPGRVHRQTAAGRRPPRTWC
jgi:3-isopropylmalate/(R)-2-methylmalate dehydratase large subunit